jgi:hypothetical protein
MLGVSPRRIAPASGLALLLLALWPRPAAHAYEDQATLGFGAGYGHFVSDSAPAHGLLTDVLGSVGLTQSWSLRGRISHAWHPGDPDEQVLHLAAGLTHAFDVIELVPYFGLGAGALARVRDGDVAVEPTGNLGLGLDYLLSREVILKLDLDARFVLTQLDSDPVYLAALGAVVFVFEL